MYVPDSEPHSDEDDFKPKNIAFEFSNIEKIEEQEVE